MFVPWYALINPSVGMSEPVDGDAATFQCDLVRWEQRLAIKEPCVLQGRDPMPLAGDGDVTVYASSHILWLRDPLRFGYKTAPDSINSRNYGRSFICDNMGMEIRGTVQ